MESKTINYKVSEEVLYKRRYIAVHIAFCEALLKFGVEAPSYIDSSAKNDCKRVNKALKTYTKSLRGGSNTKEDKMLIENIDNLSDSINEIFSEITEQLDLKR